MSENNEYFIPRRRPIDRRVQRRRDQREWRKEYATL